MRALATSIAVRADIAPWFSGRGKELVLLSCCSDLNLLPVQSVNACAPASYFGLISFDAVILVTSFHRRFRAAANLERLDYTAIC